MAMPGDYKGKGGGGREGRDIEMCIERVYCEVYCE